jgi:hypothetical protein
MYADLMALSAAFFGRLATHLFSKAHLEKAGKMEHFYPY